MPSQVVLVVVVVVVLAWANSTPAAKGIKAKDPGLITHLLLGRVPTRVGRFRSIRNVRVISLIGGLKVNPWEQIEVAGHDRSRFCEAATEPRSAALTLEACSPSAIMETAIAGSGSV